MRFTIRQNSERSASADPVMLRALGLPHGGIIRVGDTHVKVVGAQVDNSTELMMNAQMIANAGVRTGTSVDVNRAILSPAEVVRFSDETIDARLLARAAQGQPVTQGDVLVIDGGYLDGGGDDIKLKVAAVEPAGAGIIAARTRFASGENEAVTAPASDVADGQAKADAAAKTAREQSAAAFDTTVPDAFSLKLGAQPNTRTAQETLEELEADLKGNQSGSNISETLPSASRKASPKTSRKEAGNAKKAAAKTAGHKGAETQNQSSTLSTADALLAGLDNEVELMAGWFSLLANADDLATAWKIPAVAGMLLEGPNGCGKSELVAEAAQRSATEVVEVDIGRVFKPERLLDRLSEALNSAHGPRVIFVDRLESLTGDDALSTFRTQFIAVLRWFLEEVAAKAQVVCVLGVDSVAELHESISKSELLPRVISIPPPDQNRREKLFEAAFAAVPGGGDLDFKRLANLSSGFSGADVLASVVHASAMVSNSDESLTTELVAEAVKSTTPSLGSVPMGEITGFGFEKVANLDTVKQRLTEAVIWPMTQPERFERLGIEPPKGILLYGPPGTGKTFVIKALAHEAGCAFFAVKGAELLDKYVGESERAVRSVFSRARDASPSIIFFDEFDALAPVRGRSSSTVSDQVVAALLTEIDGVADRGQVAVIAATNRKDLIDGALLRAGRFETHIELGLPVKSARLALLKITDVNLAEEVDREELAEATEGLSFADLTGVLREAALATLRRDESATEVGWQDLRSALELFENRRQINDSN